MAMSWKSRQKTGTKDGCGHTHEKTHSTVTKAIKRFFWENHMVRLGVEKRYY